MLLSPVQGLSVGIAITPLIGFLESIAIAKAFGELDMFPMGGDSCGRVC